MFKLIATIYLLMNGQSVGEPMQAANRQVFASIEDCKAFAASEKGAGALENLNAQILLRLPAGASHTVTTSCEPAVDNTI